MVTGEENLGDDPPPKLGRAGVMRFLEQPIAKALVCDRISVSQHAGQQPHNTFDDRQRGHLPTKQHVVAKRDLLIYQIIGDSFVDPLVATAHQRDLVEFGKPIESRLIEYHAAGCQQDPSGVGQRVERRRQRLNHHHHPGTTTKRSVVQLAMGTLPMISKIVDIDDQKTRPSSLADERDIEHRYEELGEHGDYVDLHGCQGILSGESLERA